MMRNSLCKFLIYLGVFLCLLLSLWILAKPLTFTFWPDFNIYYHSALQALLHKNFYLLPGIFVGGYLYPPVSLSIFYPLTFLPVVAAGRIWIAISIFCLILAMWLLLLLNKMQKNFLAICITGILTCNFFPTKFTLGMGQLNTVTLLLVVLAIIALQKNKQATAGIFWGTVLTIKYFPILILFYMLVRRKWLTILATIITILILFITGLLTLGGDITYYFFQHIFPSLLTSIKTDYYNQALSGFLLRELHGIPNMYITMVRILASLGMIILTLWTMCKKQPNKEMLLLEIGIWITLSLLLNSFSWQHQFVLLLIPLVSTFFIIKQQHMTWKLYVPLILSYLLVATNMKNPSSFPILLQSHVFYGAVLLWILDVYLLYTYPKYEK